MRINKDPIYQQLNRLLRHEITSDRYKVGDKFLTERAICERYEVSRATANKSLSSLVSEGLLEFRKGVGTFVRSKPALDRLLKLTSFTENAKVAGYKATSKVLRFERLRAGSAEPVVVQKLQVDDDDEEIYLIERLRKADGIPMILENRYVVARHCPELFKQSLEDSLYELFVDKYDLNITGMDETITAVTLGKREAGLLGIEEGKAGFLVTAVGYIDEHIPLWWERTIHKPDAFEYRCQVRPNQAQQELKGHLIL
ncbi:GntR family transcriptional regulator [Marispirochaeta aestuarii]|uniref:GntR family transcriptional regulator n=1 Tax=Marispirochaeta aestuarii TaxID=1963862 RepID=UPI0029C60645|nr:GntR family transcriptional regulator [Marispirochaeta aestuarii]